MKWICYAFIAWATVLTITALLRIDVVVAENKKEPAESKESKTKTEGKGSKNGLLEIATSSKQWTGVTVSKEGRVFVCYPRWSDDVPVSCAEVMPDGSTHPFPDTKWNKYDKSLPAKCFVCVQSVFVDSDDKLWVLDPAAPKFQGPVSGGPKLVKIDLKSNAIEVVYTFDSTACPPKSYLNDVRIDAARKKAYITDSGLGAIVVLDLNSSQARRLLATHPSTKAEDIKIVINGKDWGKQPDGSYRRAGSDGIALDALGAYLYYHPLTGKSLYRIPTAELSNAKATEQSLAKKVERVAETCVSDGIEFGDDSNLFLTSIEDNSVKKFSLKTKKLETVVQDKNLVWPDTLARSSSGWMYVTSSQINLMPAPPTPYRLFKFRLGETKPSTGAAK